MHSEYPSSEMEGIAGNKQLTHHCRMSQAPHGSRQEGRRDKTDGKWDVTIL